MRIAMMPLLEQLLAVLRTRSFPGQSRYVLAMQGRSAHNDGG